MPHETVKEAQARMDEQFINGWNEQMEAVETPPTVSHTLTQMLLSYLETRDKIILAAQREEILELINDLRNKVISRSGPNDTIETRLAELSLFVEVIQAIKNLNN